MWKVSLIPSLWRFTNMCFLLLKSCSPCFLCCCGGLTSLFSFSLSHQPLAVYSAFVSWLKSAKYVHCKGPALLSSPSSKKRCLVKKLHWDPATISMPFFFTNEQLCIIGTSSRNWALGRQTLCMAFLQKEKCFRLTPDGVLMAHAKWLQECIRMVILAKSV